MNELLIYGQWYCRKGGTVAVHTKSELHFDADLNSLPIHDTVKSSGPINNIDELIFLVGY